MATPKLKDRNLAPISCPFLKLRGGSLALSSRFLDKACCNLCLEPTCSQLIKGGKIPGINGFLEVLNLGDYRVHAQFNKVVIYFLFYYQSCVYMILVGTSEREMVTSTIHPVSYTHLTLPTTGSLCRSRWSPYH